MKRGQIVLCLFLPALLCAAFEWRGENTNFTLSQASLIPTEDMRYAYNYNRLRFYGDWKEDAWFVTAIGDGVNYLGESYIDSLSFEWVQGYVSDTPFRTQTRYRDYGHGAAAARLYRLYGGYDDGETRVVLGLQNITMGVGHIWTPSNLFTPRNTYALEPDETYGVMALYGAHYFSDQSQLYGAVSQREDKRFKYAVGYKTTIGAVDVSLNAITSDQTKMASYTIEGDLGDTGIQLRSEGAWFRTDLYTVEGVMKEHALFQGILGADYAFREGVNLTIEALYSSETFSYADIIANQEAAMRGNLLMSHFYLGATMDYDFTIYLSGSLLYIESFNTENSRFISPSLTYTLNDNNTLTLGALIQNGPSGSEFGMFGNSYYLKYTLTF